MSVVGPYETRRTRSVPQGGSSAFTLFFLQYSWSRLFIWPTAAMSLANCFAQSRESDSTAATKGTDRSIQPPRRLSDLSCVSVESKSAERSISVTHASGSPI